MATSDRPNPNRYRKPSQPQQPEQPQERSYLANLFQPPADPVEAQERRDRLFGYPPPTTTAKGGSFTP